MEITRIYSLKEIHKLFHVFPVVAILGPRQCGKTTLARQFIREQGKETVHFFDLEDIRDLARLDNPMLTLEPLQGIIVMDEIQRRRELFPALRVLVDQKQPRKFLILGSASRDLIGQGSETLAGRIGFLELKGFSLDEIEREDVTKLWFRGGFPRSFLAENDLLSFSWRENFVRTFLEADLPNLGFQISPISLRRFWTMLAHYHGQLFNASELGKSLQISDTTAKRYLDILTGTFLVRQLLPWVYNTKKRLIRSPKIYFRDTGLFHTLLDIRDWSDLQRHPKLGASWEGFALEQAMAHLGLQPEAVFFWGVHGGAELDLVFQWKGRWWGIEVKYSDAPKMTKSLHSALQELSLEHLWILYPGQIRYDLHPRVTVLPLTELQWLIGEAL